VPELPELLVKPDDELGKPLDELVSKSPDELVPKSPEVEPWAPELVELDVRPPVEEEDEVDSSPELLPLPSYEMSLFPTIALQPATAAATTRKKAPTLRGSISPTL